MDAKYSLAPVRRVAGTAVVGDNPLGAMGQPALLAAALIAIAAAAAQDGTFADAAARDLVMRARAAVAGARGIDDLRSLVLRGRVRLPRDTDALDGTVEIKILLPDRYLRVETVGDRTRRSGFAGTTVLAPGNSLADQRIRFARFMLGALAYVPPEPKLRLHSAAEGALPDTEAVDVTGPAFSARLVVDAASHVPMRIVFFGERQTSTVVSFANRRPVDGFELPFRVTTQTPDRVLETLMFDEILVNPPLGPDEFRR